MAVVINFVIDNFIWFMSGAIIIILAIIGNYADKTNFGEGKKIIKVKKSKEDIIDSLEVKNKSELDKSPDNINEVKESKQEEESVNEITNNVVSDSNNTNETINPILSDTVIKDDVIPEKKEDTKEKQTPVMDAIIEENKEEEEELDELLPEKDVLDDDLFQKLGDMEEINFDSKKKSKEDIPDLDDVFLPDITSNKKTRKQLWKK